MAGSINSFKLNYGNLYFRILLERLIYNEEYFYYFITLYCPNGFELDKNFQDQVKPIFDGDLLIKIFECKVATGRAKNCTVQENCKESNYNMKEGNASYPNQDMSCVKNNM